MRKLRVALASALVALSVASLSGCSDQIVTFPNNDRFDSVPRNVFAYVITDRETGVEYVIFVDKGGDQMACSVLVDGNGNPLVAKTHEN